VQNFLNPRYIQGVSMDRATGIFVEGIGAAAATSGVLSQLQGRIFALLYLQARPLALEEIAAQLEQSKSNISINIRGLVDWHLVRRTHVAGSRKDHYEAATDFWRGMQEIMQRRFRWNPRQVLASVAETERALAENGERGRKAPGARDGGLHRPGCKPYAPSSPPSTLASALSRRDNPLHRRRSRTCSAWCLRGRRKGANPWNPRSSSPCSGCSLAARTLGSRPGVSARPWSLVSARAASRPSSRRSRRSRSRRRSPTMRRIVPTARPGSRWRTWRRSAGHS